ncbi:ATP-binding protein [Streptomyces sp. ID05-39B]|uniref:sensor histidine kinase n=1 Tax=Streptomyces sp. ID05-39B TaxID=3028664 RepID=UPI0029B232C2|nr:ATP-binding protein [Streptomyces sp. ID05-39B]MDX3529409.1 ATP-binding protein [Streptomyces sp. ID05-39B]
MTDGGIAADSEDLEAVAAYDAAYAKFTDDLNRLHIEYGAPSYSEIAKASVRPKLSRAGITEALTGKRLPPMPSLLEFVRVVSNPMPPAADVLPAFAAHPELVDEWRAKWSDVKYRQRQVQAPMSRVKQASREMVAEALREAEALRLQAHEHASSFRQQAEAEAELVRSQAHSDAAAIEEHVQELRFRIGSEVEDIRQQAQREAAEMLLDARARSEKLLRDAGEQLRNAETEAAEIVRGARRRRRSVRPLFGRTKALHRLRDVSTRVAAELPMLVAQLSEADDPMDVDTSVEAVGVYGRGIIGQVAVAFDNVHREAVRLAAEQALLRGNVNAMFTNLSRRSQGLIQRQIALISEMEARETDPDQLSSLLRLDHLATRMRRNGENLLVIAGEEPGRRWTRPVSLGDVLRAASYEVEQYERIELDSIPASEISGRVVSDLVRLLSELLENATSFSDPRTKVKVTGHALPDGRVLVEIHDAGIGLSPEDLNAVNERLASPPAVDISVSRRMGVFVIGRLSLRHGIRVQLRPSDSNGITALVMLPMDVVPLGRDGQRMPPSGPSTATPDNLPFRGPSAVADG